MSKPPEPSAEVARLDVDDHLVAGLGAPTSATSAIAGRRSPSTSTLEALHRLAAGAGLDDRPAAQLQHVAAASSRASATSSIPSSAATLTRSPGSWLRSVPLARFAQEKPAASSALASEAPPVTIRRGS